MCVSRYVKCSNCKCTITETGFSPGVFCVRTPTKKSIFYDGGCWMGIEKEETK